MRPMAQSPTVDGEVLPVLVDRRGEPEFTRGCDDRTNLDRDCDGCLRSLAADGGGAWRCRRSHRWRCVAGAIIASRPQGYVVYPGYAQPVYGPGCYWASEPLYDGLGRVVGYTGRPVQVCPGYVPPPPPPPGYAGPPPAPPPAVQLPPK